MEFPISLYSKDLTKLLKARPEVADEWVLLNRGWHQYAEGICGIDHWCAIVFMSFDRETFVAHGFDKKGDWRRVLDPKYARDLTKKKIKGTPSPYGEVGAHYRIVRVYRFKDIVHLSNDGSCYYFVDINRYFHNSTPCAIDARQHAN